MNYKDITFWNKVNYTLQLFGTGGQVTLALTHVPPIWNLIAGIATVAAMVFSVWMDDKNNNGKVDIFEKEVTVKVTSDSPIKIDTETKTNETNP